MTGASLQTSCDRGIAQSKRNPDGAGAGHRRLILAASILASSLAFIDGSVVNVGLPAIGRHLAAGGGGLSWVVNGYLLPLGALLLVGGAAGDRFGRRLLLVLGIAVFAVASVLCAAALSLPWLIAGRVLQGAGAALLMPNSLAILGANFSGEARGRAIGTWAAVGAGAGAGAPLLGGWLIDTVSWRAIFLVNLPIAAAAILLALLYVPDDRAATRPPLDLLGAALIAGALTALTWGLTVAASAGGGSRGAVLALAGGAVLLAAFLRQEQRRGDTAMMPLAMFTSPAFIGLTVLTFLLYGALGGLLVLVPYVLIDSAGYSATAAGAALLPLPLVIALLSSSMGQLAGRIGPRLPLSIGPIVVAAGCLLALRIGAGGGYWLTVLPAMLAISLGMSGAAAPLTAAVLGSVDARHTGIASGLNSAVARTGGLIATAGASVVLAAHGAGLVSLFHGAAIIGAVAAAAAGLCAWLLVPAGVGEVK